MTQDEIRAGIRELVKSIKLTEVRAIEVSGAHVGQAPKGGEPINMDLTPSFGWDFESVPGTIGVGVDMTISVRQEKSDAPYATFRWRGQVVYSATLRPAHDVMAEFCRTSVLITAWPFIREYVQSTSTRFLIPAVLLPVMLNIPSPNAVTLNADGTTTSPARRPASETTPTPAGGPGSH